MTDTHDVRGLGTILSIWAHPDDETYLAGATMAAAVAAGQRVVCVSVTAGERGTDDPVAWPPARLSRRRHREAAAAMAVLGVSEHRIVGLADGGLDETDLASGADIVGALLDEIAPDTILTFGPDGATFHPDHIAVGAWSHAAWQRRGCRARLLQAAMSVEHHRRFAAHFDEWDVYMTDERPTPVEVPAFRVWASGDLLDRKVTALAAMASQTAGSIALLGEELFAEMVAEECFVDAAPCAEHVPER
jgi:LmbE family N-acetylglucosaminyl deacetylase